MNRVLLIWQHVSGWKRSNFFLEEFNVDIFLYKNATSLGTASCTSRGAVSKHEKAQVHESANCLSRATYKSFS